MSKDRDAKFATCLRYAVGEDICCPERYCGLYQIEYMNISRSSNGLCSDFRQLNTANLPFLYKLAKYFNSRLHGDIGVNFAAPKGNR